ncbi:MFS transporter [Streptomyces akebiae]|uniref:MFS transporter n=1 Tax=Streptomyces akebiae TaxID=2865673 RepID=A0ABX8XGW2_9ACTN|nr:MFS transporter [Streptomyces akebiae]QYX75145.1 MFS transporter [Streptomyces akebiae]
MAGSPVSSVAVPYLAVVELNASTAQVPALAFLSQLPSLLVALHAGALADRHPKRPLMIGGDLVCVIVLLTLPLAAFDWLTFQQLVAVAFVQATATSCTMPPPSPTSPPCWTGRCSSRATPASGDCFPFPPRPAAASARCCSPS